MNFLEKTRQLPQPIQDFFSSDNPRWETEKACFLYGIKENGIKEISGPIGLIFVGDEKLEDLPNIIKQNLQVQGGIPYGIAYEVNRRIFYRFPDYFTNSIELLDKWQRLKSTPVISEDQAWQKVLKFEPWILEDEEENEEEKDDSEFKLEKIKIYQTNLERLSLHEALKKYPELGEQLITSNSIKLRAFPEPVRPSIKNWISDYTFNIGLNNNDPMLRGNYIFRNENTMKLSGEERERLSQLLKSLDENTHLSIDTATKQIVFIKPIIKPEQKTNPISQKLNFPTKIKPSFNQKITLTPTAEKITPKNEHLPVNSQPKTVNVNNNVTDRLRAWRKDLKQETRRNPIQQSQNTTKQILEDSDSENPINTYKISTTKSTIPDNTVKFSSPQRFPIEKINEPKKPAVSYVSQEQPTPQPKRITPNTPVDLSNIRIRPVSEQKPAMRNVVNLRDE